MCERGIIVIFYKVDFFFVNFDFESKNHVGEGYYGRQLSKSWKYYCWCPRNRTNNSIVIRFIEFRYLGHEAEVENKSNKE